MLTKRALIDVAAVSLPFKKRMKIGIRLPDRSAIGIFKALAPALCVCHLI
jgi:hypothetical protein